MSKTTYVALTAVGAIIAWQIFNFYGSEAATIARFPDLDPKLVKKAHRKMIKLALKQDPAIMNASSDEDYDTILRDIVAAYQ
jgi:hypothetical protein